MSKFRLHNIKVDQENYQTKNIILVNDKHDNNENHFTLIIGNNGTGKSRILGSIARTLINNQSRPQDLFSFSEFQATKEPQKIISVSNSLSDKFPVDSFYMRSSETTYKEARYNYLGTKTRMGSSSRALIRRAIDILLENYSNKNISKSYRYIFDYLKYKPQIKLEYRPTYSEIIDNKGDITLKKLEKYIKNKMSYSSINTQSYQNLLEQEKSKLIDVCNFLNDFKDREQRVFELDIDFSYSNISRLEKDNSRYIIDVQNYETLNIIRKLGLIRSFEVRLFKKSGESFNFSDASSGEASILCTLIALTPLVEDDSCILIDEPEISLHPSWQYRYIELLEKIFEPFSGCHIIIASHSHFLVSDLPPNNSSVVSLKLRNGVIESELIEESTFGWSAENILLNVFEMPSTRNYYLSKVVEEALELVAKKQKNKARFKKIINELEHISTQLKNEDPLRLVIETLCTI